MPSASLKFCLHPGCGEKVRSGYCEEHQRANDRARGTAYERLYDWRWRKYSQRRLVRHPWCARCQKQGTDTLATVTDHIVPHKGDRRLFWDPDNHQSLCAPCNTKKAIQSEGGFGRPRAPRGERG